MPRRNTGPKLRFLKKRNTWYVTWSEAGRSFERSTATANYKEAEIIFAEFLRLRQRRSGPRDPSEILISEVLTDYADERSSDIAAPMRLIYAVRELRKFWRNLTVADVTRETCRAYVRARGKSAGTARRELGVLRAAINHAHREGRITRTIAIRLPEKPESRERWLTRSEAAKLLKAAMQESRVRLYLPLFILVGLYSGQRKSAAFGSKLT